MRMRNTLVHHSCYKFMHLTNKALLSDTPVSTEWRGGGEGGGLGVVHSSMKIMGMFAGNLY